MAYFEIKGVLPPMATPFTADGAVDYKGFAANLERYNEAGLAGYLVLGSNSETPYLTEEEKLELVRLTVRHAAKDKIIMAGTGLESTAATLALTQKAADLGAHCALVLTPNYYGGNMGDAAQLAYFTTLADHSPIPILMYNDTKFTHLTLSPAVVSRLSAHPNIIGMKDSSGDMAQMTSYVCAGLDKEFNLMVGTASTWYHAQCMGVKGAVMALANCCPRECVQVQRLFDAGDWKAALALHNRLFPVNAAATGKYGVPGLKYIMNTLGYTGGCVRPPLLPATEAACADMDAILKKAALA